MSNVCTGAALKPITRKPTSMNAEPAIVYSRNFIAEYSLRPLPQMEISRYIGSSSSSQNTKNMIRSSDVKTPSTAVSSSSSSAKYWRVRVVMPKETSVATTKRNAVSTTIVMPRPSTPMRNCTSKPAAPASIHVARDMNWNCWPESSAGERSKRTTSASDIASTISVVVSASHFGYVSSSRREPRKITAAATAGNSTVKTSTPLMCWAPGG